MLRENETRWESLSEADRERVATLAAAVVSRLLHEPTRTLRDAAGEGTSYRYVHAVHELFGLEAAAAEPRRAGRRGHPPRRRPRAPPAVIRLGTRGSALALAQANWVAERLPDEVEIVPIRTSGDQPSEKGQTPLGGFADKSRFVKEIEDALLRGDVDLAVHSAKDVPTDFPDGLLLSSVGQRADPRDATLRRGERSTTLPEGAVVGTSSLRRRALLLAARPDLDVRDLRGNVDTRLRRLADGDFDAIVLAQAGLDRLGRGDEGRPLDPSAFVPAAGQGCSRADRDDDDGDERDRPRPSTGLRDTDTDSCLTEERDVVRLLGGHLQHANRRARDERRDGSIDPDRLRRPAGWVAVDSRSARAAIRRSGRGHRRPGCRAAPRGGRRGPSRRGRAARGRRIAFFA